MSVSKNLHVLQIVGLCVDEARCQWPEQLVIVILPCSRQHRYSPSVKAVLEGDYRAVVRAFRVGGVFPCDFHRALVGLSS